MISDVPAKDTVALNKPEQINGTTLTTIKPIAPINTIRFNTFSKYSVVGLPGLIPGMKPPCLF